MENRGRFGVLLLAGFVSISAVGVAYISTLLGKGSETEASVVVSAPDAARSSSHSSSFVEADEDGDGVPSWKEALLGTDPKNPDTNGDGISDGEEAAKKANVRASGDSPEGDAPYVAPSALPSTEALARELLATYAQARSDGVVQNSELEQGVRSVLNQNIPAAGGDLTRYTRHDLSVEADVSVAAYEGAVSHAFREALDVREYELNVFARAVSSNSSAELQKLLVTAAIYEHIRDTLIKLEVPEKAADDHLRVVNELSAVASAVRGLGEWSGDPLDALALVNTFSEKERRFTAAVSELYTLIPVLKKQSS